MRVSPVARMAPLPTIGITRKPTPTYHGTMYCRIRGRVSSPAPMARNSGSMVSRPAMQKRATTTLARARAWVVSRITCWRSPAPMAREITAAVPTASPSEMLMMTKTTGKVKLMAASSRAPS